MFSEDNQNSIAADRAVGCIVGALIGDALGVGPHGSNDLEETRHGHGPWIDGYGQNLNCAALTGALGGEDLNLSGWRAASRMHAAPFRR